MPTITLIAGPPCAGKTTLARQLAEPDHVVIDFDDIAVRLGSPRGWRHQQPIVTAASAVMARQLAELRARDDVTAWVIRPWARGCGCSIPVSPSACAALVGVPTAPRRRSASGTGCTRPAMWIKCRT
jgi:hypothetical protein